MGGERYHVETLDRGMIHTPGRTQRDGERPNHTSQDGAHDLKLIHYFWNFPFNKFRP